MPQAQSVIFEYETPEGILEWEGPADTPRDQVKAHFQQHIAKQAADQEFARRSAMTPTELGIDSAKNVGRGIISAVTGIPSTLAEVGGIAKDALMGNVSSAVPRAAHLASGMAHGFVDPIYQTGKGAGELINPGSQPSANPASLEWEAAQKASGAQLGNALVAKGAKNVAGRVADTVGSADKLQTLANKARVYTAENPPLKAIEQINVTKPLTAVGHSVRALKSGAGMLAAPALERAAKFTAARDVAPTFPDQAPPAQNPIEGFQMPPEPDPFTGNYRAPSGPAQNIEPGFQMQPEPDPFTGNYRAPSGQPQPIDPGFQMQPEPDPYTGNYRAPSESTGVAPFNLPPEHPLIQQSLANAEAGIDAAEASVPPKTRIPKQAVIGQLDALRAKLALEGSFPEVRQVSKVVNSLRARWPKTETVAWQDFLKAKNALVGDRTGVMRDVFDSILDATKDVSPEMAKARESYAQIRQAVKFR
jgi:hypothetical protein